MVWCLVSTWCKRIFNVWFLLRWPCAVDRTVKFKNSIEERISRLLESPPPPPKKTNKQTNKQTQTKQKQNQQQQANKNNNNKLTTANNNNNNNNNNKKPTKTKNYHQQQQTTTTTKQEGVWGRHGKVLVCTELGQKWPSHCDFNSPLTLSVNVLFSRAPGAWHIHVPASCQLTSRIVWVTSGCVLFPTIARLLLSSVAATGGFPLCQRQYTCTVWPRATLPLTSSSRTLGGSVQRKPADSLSYVTGY